jgi:hypothetical protein
MGKVVKRGLLATNHPAKNPSRPGFDSKRAIPSPDWKLCQVGLADIPIFQPNDPASEIPCLWRVRRKKRLLPFEVFSFENQRNITWNLPQVGK